MLPKNEVESRIENHRKPASGVNWPLTYSMIHAADIYLTRWPLKKRSESCMCLQFSIQIRRGFLPLLWYHMVPNSWMVRENTIYKYHLVI